MTKRAMVLVAVQDEELSAQGTAGKALFLHVGVATHPTPEVSVIVVVGNGIGGTNKLAPRVGAGAIQRRFRTFCTHSGAEKCGGGEVSPEEPPVAESAGSKASAKPQ